MPKLLLLLVALCVTPSALAELTLWVGDDKGVQGVIEVAKRYQQVTGMAVKVVAKNDLPQAFEQSRAAGQGPDILIWAHDRIGDWAAAGDLRPVTPSDRWRRAVAPFVWSTLTLEGQLYGYPMAVESVSLIYNRALLEQPPTDFEQLFALHAALQARGVATIGWDYINPYLSWPLLASGDTFALRTGADGAETGIDSPAAVAGAALLQRLLAAGVVDPALEGTAASAAFTRGQLAMTVNGPWSWKGFRDAGIDMAVAPLPRVEGRPVRPFVGVWAAAVTRFAALPGQAENFLEHYLASPEGLRTINRDVTLGPVAHRRLMVELAADPAVDQSFFSAVKGEPMPNNGPVALFWDALSEALLRITRDNAAPAVALGEAADRIRQAQ